MHYRIDLTIIFIINDPFQCQVVSIDQCSFKILYEVTLVIEVIKILLHLAIERCSIVKNVSQFVDLTHSLVLRVKSNHSFFLCFNHHLKILDRSFNFATLLHFSFVPKMDYLLHLTIFISALPESSNDLITQVVHDSPQYCLLFFRLHLDFRCEIPC